jgi:hypothetical protein
MANTPSSTQENSSWHVAQWGLWGWVETILRLIGAFAGIAALAGPFAASGLTLGGNPRLLGIALLVLLILASLITLVIRLRQREIISVGFAILNAAGHLALLWALLQIPASLTTALLLGIFQALGLVAKAIFLRSTGYTEMGANSQAMQGANFALLAMYIVFTVLMVG